MIRFSLTIFLTIFLVSCADKKQYVHEPIKNELLAYTEKFEKIRQGSDRYLAVATYLNPILKNSNNEEIFILSSYPKEEGINLKTLKVNNDNNIIITPLKSDDELLKLTNINLPWSHHYKITAPEKNSDSLKITYDTNRSLKVQLKFQKVSKSMYWSPEIELESK